MALASIFYFSIFGVYMANAGLKYLSLDASCADYAQEQSLKLTALPPPQFN